MYSFDVLAPAVLLTTLLAALVLYIAVAACKFRKWNQYKQVKDVNDIAKDIDEGVSDIDEYVSLDVSVKKYPDSFLWTQMAHNFLKGQEGVPNLMKNWKKKDGKNDIYIFNGSLVRGRHNIRKAYDHIGTAIKTNGYGKYFKNIKYNFIVQKTYKCSKGKIQIFAVRWKAEEVNGIVPRGKDLFVLEKDKIIIGTTEFYSKDLSSLSL